MRAATTLAEPPLVEAARADIPDSTKREFERLAAEWRSATAHLSSVSAISTHPAYRQIIGMGPQAVPLILASLAQEPAHWFPALRALTGANPVPPESRGALPEMRAAWLAWGAEHGLVEAA